MLERDQLVQLIVVKQEDFLFGQPKICLWHVRVLKTRLYAAASDHVLVIEVVVFFKKVF